MSAYRWRPDVNDWSYVHIAREGQTARTSADTQGQRWVRAVCPGGRVAPEGSAIPGAEPCQDCQAWQRENPQLLSD